MSPDFLSEQEEHDLIALFRTMTWGNVEMRGVTAKRRVIQFGWRYSFENYGVTPAKPAPPELNDIRARAAGLAQVSAEDLSQTLLIEYSPGAGMGWHRDAPPFGIVAGISLGGTCRMRFQKGQGRDRMTAALELPPRSLYLLTGESRTEWQHSIPAVKELRYSITFRTLRRSR